ncbi:MAG: V-type ATP synthase subunit A, partial [Methanomassiliicoccaceae archaeon]|nr:V-type ATP synthase subunit A [Methanomassiliicoccaceae archaeon]
CGERGNEMTEVLTEFPELIDPATGESLMKRTVLIANTSNMPVAAREASVYTGITIAEYFRDMGYDVSLMADSTSRWAEAMREISSRLEEMPGEEGFPAYLAGRLSEFYERACRGKTLNGDIGSISVIGAVSPPGGDLSEPVTQNTLRIVRVFWALDTKLRERRHFPTINWLTSYTMYDKQLSSWFKANVAEDFPDLKAWAMQVLQKESELQEIVQMVGSDSLPDEQKLTLEVAKMIREIFLQQNAYHPIDAYCPIKRQYVMMTLIKKYSDLANNALASGIQVDKIAYLPVRQRFNQAKYEENIDSELEAVSKDMETQFAALGA